ncbi:hypothetical protein Tcan_15393 [Toxocara canis]|uniref:Uncharacterized protein n=2 Tax=Toxocara canis TaxID=6265 RepID=A0A0B2W5X4_TOXCA|nr:hypothetical protein Tcan_15393 [Toxocara canis]VDM23969.1 unnamed protein product [Toxocara canis]
MSAYGYVSIVRIWWRIPHADELAFMRIRNAMYEEAIDLSRTMSVEEAVLNIALRNDFCEVVKVLHHSLSEHIHLEYAFFVMKQIVKRRFLDRYDLVRQLLSKIRSYQLPSNEQELELLRLQYSIAFIVLMGDIIGLGYGGALQTKEVASKIRKLLADSGKFYEVDRLAQESRIALMSVLMKQRRINRLRREFYGKAERISEQIETRLDRIRAKIVPTQRELPLDHRTRSAVATNALYNEIVERDGFNEQALLHFLNAFSKTPQTSVSFFESSSHDFFSPST